MRAAVLSLLLLPGPAMADDLQDHAVAGQLTDVGTTAAGLALGATEANPLGPLIIPAKLITHQRRQQDRPRISTRHRIDRFAVVSAGFSDQGPPAFQPASSQGWAGLFAFGNFGRWRFHARERAVNPALPVPKNAP